MANEKFVTGVGSRKVAGEGKDRIIEIAQLLDKAGYSLRSGGADGCDTLFEQNMPNSKKYIYLPWKGFNKNTSELCTVTDEAKKMAATVHPKYWALGIGPQKLHARNVYQVLGQNMDKPSDLLVCWTEDGCNSEKLSSISTGGTRTAIVLAERNQVPVYNVQNEKDYKAVKELLEKEIASQKEVNKDGGTMAKAKEQESFLDVVDSLEKEEKKEKKTTKKKTAKKEAVKEENKETKKETKKKETVKEEVAVEQEQKEEKNETSKLKKSKVALQIDDRGPTKTFFFPPEIVKSAVDDKVDGFTVAGYSYGGHDQKIFVPADKDGAEAKLLSKKNPKLPGWLVVTVPEDMRLKAFHVEADSKAPNGEKMVSNLTVNCKALDKIQKEHSNFNVNKKENEAKEVKDEKDVKAEAKVEGKENAGTEAVQTETAEKATKPAEAKKDVLFLHPATVDKLRNGQGLFLNGFEANGEKLATFIPMRDSAVKVKQLSPKNQKFPNWYVVEVEKGFQFHLYKDDGKGNYLDTGNWQSYKYVNFRSREQNKKFTSKTTEVENTNDNSL